METSLLTNFYTVESLEHSEGQKYSAQVRINPDHDIFKGHFPGNPVMPGVCMIQIIKELTEQILKIDLFMQQISNVKFMALINPENNPELRLDLDIAPANHDGLIKVKNVTYFNDITALKLSATYQKTGL